MTGDPAGEDPEQLASRDADQLARRSAERLYAGDAATAGLGIRIGAVGAGRAAARMRVTEAMLNGHRIFHGGYLFLLADSALGYASNSGGVPTVTAACDVVFVAPARLGDELEAVAVERVRFGRGGVYDVTVRRTADGAVLVELRGQSRAVDAPPPCSP